MMGQRGFRQIDPAHSRVLKASIVDAQEQRVGHLLGAVLRADWLVAIVKVETGVLDDLERDLTSFPSVSLISRSRMRLFLRFRQFQ